MIFGRDEEKKLLEHLLLSKRAEFLAVYGRRRIGKTFLIYEFFRDKGVYFELTGIKKASKKEQLRRFYKSFSIKFPENVPHSTPPQEWSDAFDLIKNVVEKLDPKIKFILFLDELPWIVSPKSGFLPALDYAWNHDFSRFPNLLLIVCGSAASWIIKKIIKDKGGLHGRLSAKIRLQPFTLMSHGGRSTETIEELEESGFIIRMPAFGKETKDRKIRLIDEYTFFYLSWIEESRSSILRSTGSTSNYWNTVDKTPSWYEWSGHAFENICLKHISKIKAVLGISGVSSEESHWHHFPRASSERGAKIDLLIDRADDCINLCEIKLCNSEFIIERDYANLLERKKTIFITMITPFGVAKNEHYIGLIDQQLTMDDLF